jgi:hypothetical protein
VKVLWGSWLSLFYYIYGCLFECGFFGYDVDQMVCVCLLPKFCLQQMIGQQVINWQVES